MVDVRYVVLAVILIGTLALISKRPGWAPALTLGLAAAGFGYLIMFNH
jgi:hypothetical protein